MATRQGVLAIDAGTTGVTCLVVAEDGETVARRYSEFEQHFPRPGWVEHDASEIWSVTQRLCRDALSDAERASVDVRGIGITNQRETVVLWDRATGEPVHRAIVWQDRRTTDLCRQLKEDGHESEVRGRTGLVLDPYFSGTKLTWLFDERPELRARAEAGELAAGTIDSWLIWCLTGGAVHATDPTNASRTLLYDIRELRWDSRLQELLRVPAGILPEVRSSSGEFGLTTAESIGRPVPIGGVAGDQQSALFGQGCWTEGLAKNTYGTGAFMLLHTGGRPVPSERGLLTTVACDASGAPAYALEGSIFIAGAAIQWLRDGLEVLANASESEAAARSVESTGRRVPGSRVRGSRRTPLGAGCPRHDRRSHARDPARAPDTSGAGSHGVRNRGGDRGHGGRLVRANGRAPGGWWSGAQRLAHVLPGRNSGHPRPETGAGGDHGARGSRSGRVGDRRLGLGGGVPAGQRRAHSVSARFAGGSAGGAPSGLGTRSGHRTCLGGVFLTVSSGAFRGIFSRRAFTRE